MVRSGQPPKERGPTKLINGLTQRRKERREKIMNTNLMQGGAVVAQQAHNLEVGGAIPSPATNFGVGQVSGVSGVARQCEKGRAESSIQERGGWIVWFVFHALAIYSAVSYWLRFKRVCAWHDPNPIRMGGNPWAPKVTHGICPQCFARVSGELERHAAV